MNTRKWLGLFFALDGAWCVVVGHKISKNLMINDLLQYGFMITFWDVFLLLCNLELLLLACLMLLET